MTTRHLILLSSLLTIKNTVVKLGLKRICFSLHFCENEQSLKFQTFAKVWNIIDLFSFLPVFIYLVTNLDLVWKYFCKMRHILVCSKTLVFRKFSDIFDSISCTNAKENFTKTKSIQYDTEVFTNSNHSNHNTSSVRHVTGTGSGLLGEIPRVVVQISALT